MSTYTNNSARFYLSTGSTATDNRNFLIDQHTGITSSGWAVSSDTGQMDEATVSISASLGVQIGYRIYYLNDSYHSTNPIYMKLNYTTGSSTATRMQFTVQLGTSTNGTGSMSNWLSTLPVVNLNVGASSTFTSNSGAWLGSYGEGYSTLIMGNHIASGNADTDFISVQRAFNQQTGAVQDDGTFYAYFNPYSQAAFPAVVQVIGYNRNYSTTVVSTGTSCYAKSFVPMGTTYSGSSVEIYPDIFRARVANISPITATYKLTDIANDNYITANILGANHTYRAMGIPSTNSAQSATAYGLALIWE